MKLVAPVRLLPTPEQAALLRDTLERCNAACDWLVGYAKDAVGKIALYPDQRVCEAVRLVFAKFRELWSVRQNIPLVPRSRH